MAKKTTRKKADKPLKIDLSFEDALKHILTAKPAKRKAAKRR